LAIEEVRITLEQEISLKARGSNYFYSSELISQRTLGGEARAPDYISRPLELDLSQIRVAIPEQKKNKQGLMRQRSIEDKHLGSQV